MKASEFRKLIREEIQNVLKEALTAKLDMPIVKNALTKLLNVRKRSPEDENAHDTMEQYLVQLFTDMKVNDPESLASYMMEDEAFATGTVEDMIAAIKFAMEDEETF
jgi:hypothetical protein